MAKRFIKQTQIKENYETGEVMESTKYLTETTTAEKFMKVYLNFISGEIGLKDYEKSFILELFPRAGYETNKFTLLLADKQEIAEKLGKSVSHINNMVTTLKNNNILVCVSRGKYMLNPKYFFRGDEVVRDSVLSIYKKFIVE